MLKLDNIRRKAILKNKNDVEVDIEIRQQYGETNKKVKRSAGQEKRNRTE